MVQAIFQKRPTLSAQQTAMFQQQQKTLALLTGSYILCFCATFYNRQVLNYKFLQRESPKQTYKDMEKLPMKF